MYMYVLALKKLDNFCDKNKKESTSAWVSKLKYSVNGCLELLKEISIDDKKHAAIEHVASASATKSKKDYVMISYSHSSKDIVLRLHEKLMESNIPTWIDINDMPHGSLYTAMAEAIERASIVVICYGLKYNRSPNCRMEAEYASLKEKPILFVRTEYYVPDSWLGIMLGKSLYVDISKNFSSGCETLINQIKSIREEPIKPVHVNPTHSSHHNKRMDNVDGKKLNNWIKWTSDEVFHWLNRNELTFLVEG